MLRLSRLSRGRILVRCGRSEPPRLAEPSAHRANRRDDRVASFVVSAQLEDDRTRGLARREPSLCLRPHDRPRVRSRTRSHGGVGPVNPVQVCRERSTMARGEIARSAPHTGEFVDEVPSTATPLISGVPVRRTEEHRYPMSEMVLGHSPGAKPGAERAGDSVRSPPPPDSRFLRVAHAADHAPPICDRSTPTCVNCVSPDAQTTTQMAVLNLADWLFSPPEFGTTDREVKPVSGGQPRSTGHSFRWTPRGPGAITELNLAKRVRGAGRSVVPQRVGVCNACAPVKKIARHDAKTSLLKHNLYRARERPPVGSPPDREGGPTMQDAPG